jgi:small basic protein
MLVFKGLKLLKFMFGGNNPTEVLTVAVLTFLINIPFGYWRAQVKKFSKDWFLAIHLPVPLIVAMRLLMGVHLNIPTVITFVVAFFLGQRTGVLIYRKLQKRLKQTSKNLFSDLVKLRTKTDVG